MTKSGYIALIGRPNVGKSTLLNALLGQKISITTDKPQTTRWQILGIKTLEHAQLIYVDTPGVHEAKNQAINRYMNKIAYTMMQDADVIVIVQDITRFLPEDELVLRALDNITKPTILVLNKIDKLNDKVEILPKIAQYEQNNKFSAIVPLSALRIDNVSGLERTIIELLPEGPLLFPEGQVTDKSIKFQLAEMIREKMIQVTGDELPYVTTVEIEQMKDEPKLVTIHALIWVERQGQKVIVIGNKGARLKKIGTLARYEMEARLAKKVMLKLWVKVKADWTDDEKALKQFGYD
jgi:GTPase